MNREYDENITQILNELMKAYKCNSPLEALTMYAKDYEASFIEEMELQGISREEALKKLEWETTLFDIECATDIEKSIVHSRVLKLIEDDNKYLGRRIDDI